MLRLVMHSGIAQDERTLTKYQGHQILNTLRRLQKGVTGFDEIEPLTGNLTGYHKFKPSAESRYNCNMEVRAVFRITDTTLEVYAVGARDDVYARAAKRVNERAYA